MCVYKGCLKKYQAKVLFSVKFVSDFHEKHISLYILSVLYAVTQDTCCIVQFDHIQYCVLRVRTTIIIIKFNYLEMHHVYIGTKHVRPGIEHNLHL